MKKDKKEKKLSKEQNEEKLSKKQNEESGDTMNKSAEKQERTTNVEKAGQKKEGTLRRMSKKIQDKLSGRKQNDKMLESLRQDDEIFCDEAMDMESPRKHEFPKEITYIGPMKLILLTNPSDEHYTYTVCLSCWVLLCHLLIGSTVFLTVKPILMKVLVTNYTITSLDWHIILCTIGFQLLIAESILCLNHYNGCAPPLNQFHRKRGHWVIQIFGFVSAVFGILLIEFAHDFDLNRFFMRSLTIHEITGFITILLTTSCFVNGVCALYSERFGRFGTLCKAVHNFIGIPAFILSTVAFCSGIMLRQYLYHTEIYVITSTKKKIINVIRMDVDTTTTESTSTATSVLRQLNDLPILPNFVPTMLIVFSCIYTVGIVLLPFIKFFNCCRKTVMY